MTALSTVRTIFMSSLAVIGGLAIITLMLHIVADVVLRSAINWPLPATYEIVTNYYMVALAFIPLAWLERGGGMVHVEVLEPLMGPTVLDISNRSVAVLSTVVYGALTYLTFGTATKSFASGTFVMAQNAPIPTWPAYFLLPMGFGFACLVTAARIFRKRTT